MKKSMLTLFFRRGHALLLSLMLLCLAACKPISSSIKTHGTGETGAVSTETAEVGVVEELTGEYALLENDLVRFAFERKHGILVGITNCLTGREYLDASKSNSGYYMTVDAGTGNIWETETSGITVDRYKQTAIEATIVKTVYPSRQTLTIVQTLAIGNGTVTVTQTVTLGKESDTATFSMHIANTATDAAVTSIRYVVVDNILNDESGLNLLWPNREGELFEDALNPNNRETASLEGIYPVPLSMQFVSLFNDTESLYYAVHDEERTYKTIGFSRDHNGMGRIQTTLWPFVGSSSEKTLPDIELGVFCGDRWYTSADRYRSYLLENGYDKERSELATEFVGVCEEGMINYPNQYSTSYEQMPTIVQDNWDINRIPLTVFLGWHNDGFDSRYPDFKFSFGIGGEVGFRQAMSAIDKTDGYAAMYLNLHISETKSTWFNTKHESGEINGYACAIRDVDGKVTEETYEDTAAGLCYLAMCPSAQAYQEAIVEAATRLAKNGADGLYLDQISCMPAALCYNAEHGHSSPATAYAEGYDSILQKITAVMRQYSDNFIILCEGTCDAYLKYIDVCAGNFTRLMDYADYAKGEVGRYILPTYFYGRRTSLTSSMEASSYGHAFVLANGIFAENQNAFAKRLAELMYDNPSVYFHGRFMDQRGLADVADSVYASLFLSEDGMTAAIHLFNDNQTSVSVPIRVDLSALDLSGHVCSVVNAETGETVAYDYDNGGMITLEPKEAIALRLTIE